jgi:hypothetical protein
MLGAAAACKNFCKLLFDDPLQAAALLGIVLTETELAQLEQTFSAENRDELCSHLDKVAQMVCRKPPCPFAPVIPGDKDFCKKAA